MCVRCTILFSDHKQLNTNTTSDRLLRLGRSFFLLFLHNFSKFESLFALITQQPVIVGSVCRSDSEDKSRVNH